MKKEDLFESFGALDDDLLERSEQEGSTIKQHKKAGKTSHKILRLGSIAACLITAISVGIYFIIEIKTPDIPDKQNKMSDHYSVVASLLAEAHVAETQALVLSHIKIGKYYAAYQKTGSVESSRLAENVGVEVEGLEKWYKLSGHEDMQYLIFFDRSEYSLWEFDSFQTGHRQDAPDDDQTTSPQESYPYRDVMEIIYNIRSANDIAKIIVDPPTMDNTPKGKELQAEIGTNTITDSEDIAALYDILSGLTCYGDNHWEMVGLGDDSPSAMQNYTKAGRYLTLITSKGMEINTLKYAGINGMFYEYGGIAYNVLTGEEKSTVEKILNIKPGNSADTVIDGAADTADINTANIDGTYIDAANSNGTYIDAANSNGTYIDTASSNGANIDAANTNGTNTASQTEPGNPETGNPTSDVPVDENTYHEAREYSAELTDLQNRISEAMKTRELPFVILSATYENPDRLHVVVTTKDEELLTKLKAYDTTGRLLEIEYSENSIMIQVAPKSN